MAEPRVIFVNRVYWPSTSATAQLLTDLAEGLANRGWDVHVVATGEVSTRRHNVTIHCTGTPEPHGGLLSRALNHRRFLRAARRLLDAVLQPADILVALTDPPLLGLMAAEAATGGGVRIVHWIQDIYPEIAAVHFGPVAKAFLAGLKSRRDQAWQAASACVTLGEDMARFVATRGVAPARITLVPNWAPRELDTPVTPADSATVRREWKADGRFVVAYSGNLGRVHEFATILDAAGRLKAKPEFQFLFIGQGARFDEVAAITRRRGLTNVRLLPAVPRAQLAASLAAADVHLVTLRPEYNGLVYPSKLAGALAAGVPVLFVGPENDIVRLLQRNGCGAAVACGDGPGLSATLERWQADPQLHSQLRAQARAAYVAAFAAEPALDRWSALLRDVRERS